MFSGVVREFARVTAFEGGVLTLESRLNPAIGDSIAVNGVCLTAISSSEGCFCVELSDTSSSIIAIENIKGLVHIEPALRMGDMMHGHMVQGHVDFVGVIVDINHRAKEHEFTIQTSPEANSLIINKGSICIDGISLTVADDGAGCSGDLTTFRLCIIPHTFENSLFHTYSIGRRVNIETDVIARSIEKMMKKAKISEEGTGVGISWSVVDSIGLMY